MDHRRYALFAPCALFALAALACAPEVEFVDTTVRTLDGTAIDGKLRTGGDGELIVDRHTRWLYDYFLTAEDELGDDRLRAEVVAEANERLDRDAARRAIEIFDAYVEFRREAREIGRDEDLSLEDTAALLRDAHARHLGEVQGFAADLDLIDQAVAVRRVLDDATLDREAKAERIGALLGRGEHTAAMGPVRARRAVTEARARGADDAEIFAIRAELLGEGAASRLAALDQERAAWQARLDDYRREASHIREVIIDEAARAEALDRLAAERFSEADRLRLRAQLEVGDVMR
jgi:lipase chaperone LimK